MHEFGGNVSAAARQLGISRNTLYRRMARMN
jgi:transcriptional regulator of acetoin/glycerol metabolism